MIVGLLNLFKRRSSPSSKTSRADVARKPQLQCAFIEIFSRLSLGKVAKRPAAGSRATGQQSRRLGKPTAWPSSHTRWVVRTDSEGTRPPPTHGPTRLACISGTAFLQRAHAEFDGRGIARPIERPIAQPAVGRRAAQHLLRSTTRRGGRRWFEPQEYRPRSLSLPSLRHETKTLR
jgi:hypothetical protein